MQHNRLTVCIIQLPNRDTAQGILPMLAWHCDDYGFGRADRGTGGELCQLSRLLAGAQHSRLQMLSERSSMTLIQERFHELAC